MRRLLAMLVLAVASCGGGDTERTLEEWLAEEVPDVDDERVECVADELRGAHSQDRLAEWTQLDVSSWSNEDYLEHPDVSSALAAADFGCLGSELGP